MNAFYSLSIATSQSQTQALRHMGKERQALGKMVRAGWDISGAARWKEHYRFFEMLDVETRGGHCALGGCGEVLELTGVAGA